MGFSSSNSLETFLDDPAFFICGNLLHRIISLILLPAPIKIIAMRLIHKESTSVRPFDPTGFKGV
jgi:hypothetical protein